MSDAVPQAPRSLGLLCRQLLRFAVVGGMATVTHMAIFAAVMELRLLPAMLANTVAFLVAVLVSFLGHFSWTYRENTRHLQLSAAHGELLRFFVTALIGFGLNSLVVWVSIELLRLHYVYALVPMATAVPLVVFAISRYWVFPARGGE